MKKNEWNIETDWVINTLCNFNCEYCIVRSNKEHPDVGRVKNGKLIGFFNNTGLTWAIHLTGGEPFLYPNFIDLCEGLSQEHFISINTNLSQENIFRFGETINPKRVIFINCGLHIVERENKGLVEDFIKKIVFLKSKGFTLFVSYVMYPPLFKRFKRDFDFFKSKNIIICPKALRGRFFKKRYPRDYSQEEKRLFKKYSIKAEKLLKRLGPSNFSEGLLIDLSLDRKFLEGIPNFHGKLCLAGKKFVRIWPNGVITRCGRKRILGNIFDPKLHLFKGAKKCDSFSCPYFCFRYLVNKI